MKRRNLGLLLFLTFLVIVGCSEDTPPNVTGVVPSEELGGEAAAREMIPSGARFFGLWLESDPGGGQGENIAFHNRLPGIQNGDNIVISRIDYVCTTPANQTITIKVMTSPLEDVTRYSFRPSGLTGTIMLTYPLASGGDCGVGGGLGMEYGLTSPAQVYWIALDADELTMITAFGYFYTPTP